jgi:gamma-glutamyltranspeptidase/glutathione hydrolase
MCGKLFISRLAAVATEHPLASLAAFEVLRAGGDAVDAAVAAGFSLAVTQHHLGGLGGDFFALIFRRSQGRVYCINASGGAPSGLTVEAVKSRGFEQMPTRGPYSVTVPGLVKGLYSMHQRFGVHEFSKLLDYPIRLAEEGFPASPGLCRSIDVNKGSFPKDAIKDFLPNGHTPKPGDIIRQRRLALVLKEVQARGPDGFYNGWVAEKIADAVSQDGPAMTLDDLRTFEAEWVEPLKSTYREMTVYEVPPNSMGATTLLILKYLEQLEPGRFRANSAERIDITVRAAQAAYRKRDLYLADPRFSKIDIDEFLQVGQTEKEAQHNPIPRVDEGDTTYFAIADEQGNIVSGIQSLFHHFGSHVYVRDCGIFLNSRAAGFRLEGPNKVEPHKRPLHTLSSTLMGPSAEPTIALGCSGGDYRPQQHALFITNLTDYAMSLEDAVDFPRFLWTGGRNLLVEQGYMDLDALNYDVEVLPHPGRTGVAQGVQITTGVKKAVCDIRGDGIPLGF